MKKTIAFILGCLMLHQSTFAYNFREPDWGALLNHMTNYVNKVEFGLYGEGRSGQAVHFGAKNEPQSGVLFGMTDDNIIVDGPMSSYLSYIELDYGQTDLTYPGYQHVRNNNAVSMIALQTGDVSNVRSQENAIHTIMQNLKGYNRPMIVRYANEMNVSSLGNEPEVYKDAFRFVADIVHSYDFATVWAPNDMGGLDRPMELYYPGDEYVDWIGVSSYMKKYFQGQRNTQKKDTIYFMTGDYAWHTTSLKPVVEFMEKNRISKPIMISEGGVANQMKDGEDLTDWAEPRLRAMYWNVLMKYPQVKMINYFNKHMSIEPQYYDISNNPRLREIVENAYQAGHFLKDASAQPEYTLVEADQSRYFGDVVKLYAYSYIPDHVTERVEYTLNGQFYHTISQIPFTCNLSARDIPDGTHTLAATAYAGNRAYGQKSYKLIKKGKNFIIKPMNQHIDDQNTDRVIMTINNSQTTMFGVPTRVDPGNWNVCPVIQNDRTLVPVRYLAEITNADISYDSGKVTISKDGVLIQLTIDSMEYISNGNKRTFDTAPKIIEGRTMLPLRAITDELGLSIDYQDGVITVNL